MTNFPPFGEQHELFRQSVRTFTEREIRPHAEKWDAERFFPDELFRRAGELGYFGLRYDPRYGGSGLDYWYVGILIEELMKGRNVGAVVGLLIQCELATNVIHEYGSEELKQEWLVPAIKGEKIAALGVTEPGTGSDVGAIVTIARRDGDEYVVNGSKTFITNGVRADFVTLAVRTGGPGTKGVSLVIAPTKLKGFSIGRRLEPIMATSSDMAELFFDDYRIPAGNLVGEENRGFHYIMDLFQGERLVLGYILNGWAKEMLDEAMAYAEQREAFGMKIAQMQVWRHRFADLLTEFRASKLLTYYATDRLTARDPASQVYVSMAKLFASEFIIRASIHCMQVFGGYGLMADSYIGKISTGITGAGVGAGTSEIMREIIAKQAFFTGTKFTE